MVRYNNKYEKNERKKLQRISCKSEIHSGKIKFNSDPWDEEKYNGLKSEYIALVMKITADHSGKTFYLYDTEMKQKFEATFTKSLPKELSKFLVIGDNLYYQKKGNEFEIIGRQKRKNKLSRIKADINRLSLGERKEQIFAVNIDYGIIISSVSMPKFNPGMIERYLLLFEYHGIKPILCLTKTDLYNLPKKEYQLFKDLGLEIFHITNTEDDELIRFKNFVFEKTVVFVGNSGVGKTSLTNKMYGEIVGKEGDTSKKTGYGKHTTTSSCIYEWKDNSFIIDTPGIMNLNLFEADKENLKYLFSDFAELNSECKYKKCTHIIEPDCAVIEACNNGKISKARFNLYIHLFKQL